MLDSQFEELKTLLSTISKSLTGVLAISALMFIVIVFIFLVVFFAYYDKEQDRKRKDDDARVKRIIAQYKQDDSKM